MAELTSLNGAPLRSERKVSIILNYDLNSGKLALDGDLQNLDLCLNVMAQATRWLDCRYQLQQSMILQSEIDQQRQIAAMTRQ